MNSREVVENFTVDAALKQPERIYFELGQAVMNLARYSSKRDELALRFMHDQTTEKPLAMWNRNLHDGIHHITTTPWSDQSFILYDLRQPAHHSQGFLRLYLYGDDSVVRGLRKASKIQTIRTFSDIPSRIAIEENIAKYTRKDIKNSHITSRQGVATFARLMKSVLSTPD